MRIHTIVLWKLILFMILDVVWLASSPTKFEKPFKCQNVQLFQEIIACVYFFSVFHTFGNIQLFLQNFSYWSVNYQNVQLFKLFHFCTFQLFNFSAFSDIQLMKKIIVGTKWENLQILFKTHRLSTSSFCLFSSVHTFSFRAVLKILLLVFKGQTGQAPAYIRHLLLPYEPVHCLRSDGTALLMVLRSRLITKGDRAFAVRAPQLWNSLPGNLRQESSVASFKSLLKSYFYQLAFSWFWTSNL